MNPFLRSVLVHGAAFAALALVGLVLWKPRAVTIMIETVGRFCF